MSQPVPLYLGMPALVTGLRPRILLLYSPQGAISNSRLRSLPIGPLRVPI